MKNFKKPLIIFALILVFGGVAYWDEWKTKKDVELAKDKDRLIDMSAASVSEVHYQKSGDEAKSSIDVTLLKKDGKWQVTSPGSYPADSETVDRWLKTIEDSRFEKAFDASAEKLKDYGLEKPQISIGLKNAEGREIKLLIGAKSPVGYSTYVKREDNPSLYLVSHYLYTASNKELADFRDKSLGFPALAQIQGFTFQNAQDAPVVLKRTDKEWAIEAPQSLKADSQETASFLAFLERQKVERFIDQPSPELIKALSEENQGSRRLARLQLEVSAGAPITYDFIDNNGVIYTKLPGQGGFAALDKKVEEGLNKHLKDFQFRGMFSFNSTEIKQVDVDGKVYEKKDDQWRENGKSEPADFVRLLLVDLEFSKAEEVLSKEAAAPGMQGKPLHEVKIVANDGKLVSLALWPNKSRPGTVYLKRGDDGFFLASADLLSNFTEQSKPVEKDKVGGEG